MTKHEFWVSFDYIPNNTKFQLFILVMTQEAFVDSVDQDQAAQNVQSDLDLHCPHFYSKE